MGNDGDYIGIFLEYVDDRLDLILEILVTLKSVPADIKDLRDRMDRMENQANLFEVWMKEHSIGLKGHETRLGRLEAA